MAAQPNSNTVFQNCKQPSCQIPANSFEPTKTIQSDNSVDQKIALHGSCLASQNQTVDVAEPKGSPQDYGREKLKRHWREVAGRVLIPDKWGHEEILKDWIDYAPFDALLAPSGVMSAREALVEEGRRSSPQGFRVEIITSTKDFALRNQEGFSGE
ncbi:hypothetical protein F0562_022254 [Nyssa sinensis]|uniref:Protein BIC1 n=1 Tax=Nyssa sinensis TaxID=561372 RepID=A0A5J5BR58_9ASTE|nr:hypothetical protein F0562_022254 [Nyssa sinensis]